MTAEPKGKPERSGLKIYIAGFPGVYLRGSIVVVVVDRGHAARLANQTLQEHQQNWVTSKNASVFPVLTLKDFRQINSRVAEVVFVNDGDY
jgi:hypothetical protein